LEVRNSGFNGRTIGRIVHLLSGTRKPQIR
jgi:hypothetical protein